MKKRIASVCITLILGMTPSSSWAAPKAAWSPNKALLGHLAPATAVGPYQIQPPKGYSARTIPGPTGILAQIWIGPTRADATRNVLMLTLYTPPAGQENEKLLSQLSAEALASARRRRKDWKQTPSEIGTVNGMTFIRMGWQGTDLKTGLSLRGFSYIALAGKGFLELSSQDAEGSAKTTLPLVEASVLTFRKH